MKYLKLIILSFASLSFYSCSNVKSLLSLEIRTLDFKKVDEETIGDRTRSLKTIYPFMAVELDLSDSTKVPAGKTVKILAQEAPNFNDITFKKPKRLLAYRPDVRFLLEMPDGKRVWGVLPEASIGIKAFCLETQDTVMITNVVRTSAPVRESRYNYLYVAGSKRYTFEELGWGLKNQIYYYNHHTDFSTTDERWTSKLIEWYGRNPLLKSLTGSDDFYQYPRFSFMNTRWMSNGWHIVFIIVGIIVTLFLYLLLLYSIVNTFFIFLLRSTIFRIKWFSNGTVQFLSKLLLLVFFIAIVYYLSFIGLFVFIIFYLTWGGIELEVEMCRCPYCHSVGKLTMLSDSDSHTTIYNSDISSRDVLIKKEHSEHTDYDGTRVHTTTRTMQRQSFRNKITQRRWKENYYCNVCHNHITYSKSDTDSQEYRVK